MNRARSLGSAHRGITAFLVQRITSIYLGCFTVYLIVWLVANPTRNYASWSAHFASGFVRLAWGLFFVSLLLHAWTGLRSIYMDYLKPTWLKFSVSTLTAVALSGLALWAAYILIRGVA